MFEAVGLPEQFDTFLLKIRQKMRQCGPKNYFWAAGLRGGLEKNSFTQISFISKTFKINFMSWDTDMGSLSPFPLLKLHINFLSLGKRHFLINFRGVHDFFLATAV